MLYYCPLHGQAIKLLKWIPFLWVKISIFLLIFAAFIHLHVNIANFIGMFNLPSLGNKIIVAALLK